MGTASGNVALSRYRALGIAAGTHPFYSLAFYIARVRGTRAEKCRVSYQSVYNNGFVDGKRFWTLLFGNTCARAS